MRQLDDLEKVSADIQRPDFDRAQLRPRILHIGTGAFFRAHTGVYTDGANGAGGQWGIVAASLRSPDVTGALHRQTGLYSVLTRAPGGTQIAIIGSVIRALGPADRPQITKAIAAPTTEIVTLTITEKGYVADSGRSNAVLLLCDGLHHRRHAKVPPLTLLSCDNLNQNGAVLRDAVLRVAKGRDPALADWIAQTVRFPNTMVDRITPASDATTYADAAYALGCRDDAAVETEPFRQWVIEDRFAGDRPDWGCAGATFVSDVRAHEVMKLRMLNGAHSLIAYTGLVAGHAYVRDAMADPPFRAMVASYMRAAAATLPQAAGLDPARYADQLLARFANPAIAHATEQIAMDGSQKLPPRVLSAAVEALKRQQDLTPFAFMIAAWIRHLSGQTDAGTTIAVRDPRRDVRLGASSDPVAHIAALPDFFTAALAEHAPWQDAIRHWLGHMTTHGIAQTVRVFADRHGAC